MLVTAGISDPRVTYWEPAKWVAKPGHRARTIQPIAAEDSHGSASRGIRAIRANKRSLPRNTLRGCTPSG